MEVQEDAQNEAKESLLDNIAAPAAGRADALVDPLLGARLGNYEILFVLGKGAYGVVYKARDVNLGRFVAIKFLHEFLDAQHEAMFLREAKAVAALAKHTSIVQIFEFNAFEKRNYFVLEFVGSSASMLLRVHPKGLPIEQASNIVIDSAEGLHYAHRHEIIHRDVKPANILLEIEGGKAKIADFGVAKFFDPVSGAGTEGPGGSPAYMAPEIIAGGSGDPRSDLFSLGVTLYELLCGKLPYAGRSVEEMMRSITQNQRVPLREVNPKIPDSLADIVEQALSPDPEDRFQTGDAFAAALRGAVHGPKDALAGKHDATTQDQVAKAKVRAYKAAEDAKRAGAEKLAHVLLNEGVSFFRDAEAHERLRQFGPAVTRFNQAKMKLDEAEQSASKTMAEIRFLKAAQAKMQAAKENATAHDGARLAASQYNLALREEQTARSTPALSDATLRYAKAGELYKAATAIAREHAECTLAAPRQAALEARNAAVALEAKELAPQELGTADRLVEAAPKQIPNYDAARQCYDAAKERYAEAGRVAVEKRRLLDETAYHEPIQVAGIDFIWITPGTFVMGNEAGHSEERPAHEVTIAHGFWIGKYPVTQGQWQAVMQSNPSGFQGDEALPVENVSWNDCQAFIARLSEACGETFRLPTEAEWEYACRAGATGDWCFGSDPDQLGNHAWHPDNANGRTQPVGQKHPNAWGLHDMHGNVCEWCQDDWHDGYEGAPVDGSAWVVEGARDKATRGGSWCMLTAECRASSRDWRATPGTRTDFMGFRLCKEK